VVLNLAWIPFRKIFKTFYDFTDETKFGRNGVDEREREKKSFNDKTRREEGETFTLNWVRKRFTFNWFFYFTFRLKKNYKNV
jgi:hypothetical protein